MSNSVSHARLPYPILNARFTISVPFLDADGDPVDPTSLDTEISQDNGAFGDAAEEVTLASGSRGMGIITLTGAEMNNSSVGVWFGCSTAKATLATLYPRNLAIVGSGTLSAGSAGGGTLGTILAYDVAGCFIRTTGGTGGGGTGGANNQARRIVTYTPSTGAFTVSPNWETTPDATTTYDVLLPEGLTLGSLKALNPTTPGNTLDVTATGAAGIDWGNVENKTTTNDLTGTNIKTDQKVDVNTWKTGTIPTPNVTGVPIIDFKYILGTAVTEGAAGRDAAAWTKFFNVATPTGTVNSLPDAVPAANGGLATVDANNYIAGIQGTKNQLDDLNDASVSAIQSGLALATDLAAVAGEVTSILGKFLGITALGQWLGALMGKQVPNATALSEIRATGAGSGTFSAVTDSVEALRDRGDAAWITATGFAVAGDAMTLTAAYDAAKTAASPAQVNAEVVDALATDTYAEPGQVGWAATASLVTKVGFLAKLGRNRLEQTSTELHVMNDDGTTVGQKATVSDDATTYVRGEIGSGP